MVFRKINSIPNVGRFAVNRYGSYFLTTDLDIPKLPDLDLQRMGFNKYTDIFLLNNYLLIQDLTGKEILYDLSTDSVVSQQTDTRLVGCGYGGMTIANDRNLICWKTEEGSLNPYLHDLNNNTFKKISGNISYSFNDGQVLLHRHSEIESLSRIDMDGNVFWKHDFEGSFVGDGRTVEEPNKLSRVHGVHDDLLWISNYANELVAINVESGEIVHSSKEVGYPHFFVLDHARHRLVSVDTHTLRTIDISKGQFKQDKKAIENVFQQIGCKADAVGQQFPIVDDYLIFYNRFKSVIGALHINDVRIDWTHDLFDTRDYAMINSMDYCKGKLYVLDNAQTLHEFEKTS